MAERKCPGCRASIPDSDFITLCPACGQALEAPKDAPGQASPSPEAATSEPTAKDVVCPACGAPNARASDLCWQCRRSLSGTPPTPSGPSGAEHETLHLGRVFADALATRGPQEDLDEALLRAAKAASAEHWNDLFTIALHMLSQAAASGEQREAAAARLAGEQIEVEISSSEETSHIESGEPREDVQVFSSLDDLPPEVREAVEKRIGSLEGRGSSSRTNVTRRVVLRGGAGRRPSGRGVTSVSRSATVRSHRGAPRGRGCVSLETLAALVLGFLGLRR